MDAGDGVMCPTPFPLPLPLPPHDGVFFRFSAALDGADKVVGLSAGPTRRPDLGRERRKPMATAVQVVRGAGPSRLRYFRYGANTVSSHGGIKCKEEQDARVKRQVEIRSRSRRSQPAQLNLTGDGGYAHRRQPAYFGINKKTLPLVLFPSLVTFPYQPHHSSSSLHLSPPPPPSLTLNSTTTRYVKFVSNQIQTYSLSSCPPRSSLPPPP